MQIYSKTEKSISGWGYWGNYGEIEVGLSSGYVGLTDNFQKDKLHYHQKGHIYILTLDGSGIVEVDGKKVKIKKDTVLSISPGEKYRHASVIEKPFSWITFCTSKDPKDKVVIE